MKYANKTLTSLDIQITHQILISHIQIIVMVFSHVIRIDLIIESL
jgi:hypothetical protein